MSERSAALLGWYDHHQRLLPWRATTDPYPVLVSEVMLQQTQVDRVVDRHRRFLDRYPTVESLAVASLAEVLAEWSGLGYNRRAQRLHAAACVIARDGWPQTVEGLAALPGIGPYTAAAVASISFGVAAPAIDTNLRRVLSRWNGSPLDTREAAAFASSLIDPARPGAWNQAVMDLGAAHCRPRDPRCDTCPVERWCADAGVYVAPRPQGRFDGSSRQARGAVIRVLVDGPATLDELTAAGKVGRDRLESACDALESEGMVVREGATVRLA